MRPFKLCVRLAHVSVPRGEGWEWRPLADCKRRRPAKDARQHVLHKDARRKPREIGEGELFAQHVGPRPARISMHACDLGLQPIELAPDLTNLGLPRRQVHAACGAVPSIGQIHGSLAVRKPRGTAVGRCNVEVVDAYEEVHELPTLCGGRLEGRGMRAVLVIEVVEDHIAFEHRGTVGTDESWHLLKRVEHLESWRLQVRICHHASIEFLRHALL